MTLTKPADDWRIQITEDTAAPAAVGATAQDIIARISLDLAATPDSEVLTRSAFAIGKELSADYFIISRLNPYSNIMRTLRFVVDGAEQPSIVYSLDDTPCARAIDGGVCIYEDRVADLFPRDKFLKEHGISGYAGVVLRGAGGQILGVMLALTRKPISAPAQARAVLEHFRDRIASAIETAETIDRYGWAIAEATDGVWDWDVVTGGTTLSPSIQQLLGYAKGGPYDLTQIESAIHPDDRSLHAQALRDHLNKGTPFDVTIRLMDRTGVYRWFRSRGKAMRNPAGRPVRMIGCFSDVHDLVIAAKRKDFSS